MLERPRHERDADPEAFVARVVRVVRVTPRMVRVSLGADGLARFGRQIHAGECVQLFFAPPGRGAPVLPWIDREAGRVVYPDGAPRAAMRSFVVRRVDGDQGELDVDIALCSSGPAVAWARAARPGDVIGVVGPSQVAPWRVGGDRRLLAADASALPAVATVLEALPADARGAAFVEVEDPGEQQPLTRPDGIALTWVHRDGRPVSQGPLLEAVVRWPWPAGEHVAVWAAGEASVMRALRAYLQSTRGLQRDSFRVVDYWRERHGEDQPPQPLGQAIRQDAAEQGVATMIGPGRV